MPCPRVLHAATLIGSNMWVFGGMNRKGGGPIGDLIVLDTLSMAWSSPKTTGMPPSPRIRPNIVPIGKSLLVHGGETLPGENYRVFDDLYQIFFPLSQFYSFFSYLLFQRISLNKDL